MKTPEEIRHWLQVKIAEQLRIAPETVSPDIEFADYGLDSIVIVTLVGDLEDWLDLSLDPTIFWEYPTIQILSERLAQMPPANR